MKIIETVREILDEAFEPSRPSKPSTDAAIAGIFSEVADGFTSGEAAYTEVAVYLVTSYGDIEFAKNATARLFTEFNVPFEEPVS